VCGKVLQKLDADLSRMAMGAATVAPSCSRHDLCIYVGHGRLAMVEETRMNLQLAAVD
jgi:hypothetical protein